MSGGVDSSVAAALLKRAGVDVIGVFIRLNRFSAQAEKRARKVAKILNIPFYVFNFGKEFKKRIVDYFLKENKKGLTPNPCVVCNKEIKFGLLLEKILKMGVGFVATGHYARLVEDSSKQTRKLYAGRDKEKDQSYFLWRLSQRQLKHILFPVGNYERAEVEKLARKFKLPFAGVRKSQEICFIPKTVEDFLKRHLKSKPGQIISKDDKVIGKHQGLWFYTIGQRKGIGLPQGPYYVLDKDLRRNILIVTKKERDLCKKELIARKVNWISGKKPKLPLRTTVKIRYRHKAAAATIYPTYKIIFNRAQRAVTPGQSVVFYKNQEVVGGGIIC